MSESLLVEKIVEALTHVETPAESLSLFTDNPNMQQVLSPFFSCLGLDPKLTTRLQVHLANKGSILTGVSPNDIFMYRKQLSRTMPSLLSFSYELQQPSLFEYIDEHHKKLVVIAPKKPHLTIIPLDT